MGLTEEIRAGVENVKRSTNDLIQKIGMIEGTYDTKQSEIKALEMKKERLAKECEEAQAKTSGILVSASEKAAQVSNEAKSLMEEARIVSQKAKEDKEEAQRLMNEAKALMSQAETKQRTADHDWRVMEEKKKKIEEALR